MVLRREERARSVAARPVKDKDEEKALQGRHSLSCRAFFVFVHLKNRVDMVAFFKVVTGAFKRVRLIILKP